MKVLIACEYSGITRECFVRHGHISWSCDLLPTEIPGPHYQGNILDILDNNWDLMIAYPPCTHLAVSGARHFKDKFDKQKESLEFVLKLMKAPIKRIAIENPVSIISTKIRTPDQIINPYQFGHPYTKRTCLWLKNLPLLIPTNIIEKKRRKSINNESFRGIKYSERGKERSRTWMGIADAMAEQWGVL